MYIIQNTYRSYNGLLTVRRTCVSPASILFADKLDLNIRILTPHLSPKVTSSNSTYISDLIGIQDKVLDAAILELQRNDDKHKKPTRNLTVFPIGSYVLVKQEHPPSRLHTKWKGPFPVVSFNDSEYVLANLITHKHNSVHAKNLKIFNYDPSMGLPLIQHVAITWSISLRKFLITQVIQRNRHRCRSM